MVSAKQLFAKVPNLQKQKPLSYSKSNEVYRRAIPHTQRGNLKEFYDIERPYETPEIKAYRDAIRRNITMEVPSKWLSKTTRILQFSGHGKDNRSLSDPLSDHLSTNPFFIKNERHPFHHWMFRKVLPKAIEDANSRCVVIPYNPLDLTLPPANFLEQGGLSSNQRVYPIPVLVRHDQICYDANGVFAFQHGHMEVLMNSGDKKKAIHPTFFLIDMEAYWRLIPISEKGKIKYVLRPWYVHSRGQSRLDRLPVIGVPGRIKCFYDHNNKTEIEYKESYLSDAFEYGHETLMAFSNDQGIRAVHGNPKLQVPNAVCNTCKGEMTIRDAWDKELGDYKMKPCTECHGSGTAPNPGAYSVYVSGDSHIDGKGVDAFKYAAAPVAPLQHSWTVWRTLKDDMMKTVGLDLMDTDSPESGEAKKMRENTLKDLLKEYAEDIHYFEETLLWIMEQLIIIDPNSRMKPRIPRVVDFELRSIEELRAMAKDSDCVDYREQTMKYLKYAYRDNEDLANAHSLAMEYAPLINYKIEDWDTLFTEGRFSTNDIIKRDFATIAFGEILSNPINKTKTKKQLFELADQWFVDNDKLVSEDIIESRGLNSVLQDEEALEPELDA